MLLAFRLIGKVFVCMASGLTLHSMMGLFGAMVVLAAIPGVSVLTVSARSAACGFIHGVFTTLGIMVGDLVFIVLAICGLSILAETMHRFFIVLHYAGGLYLIGLGVRMWRMPLNTIELQQVKDVSLFSSFLVGLLITLGDVKAIVFYLGFFPAFLDVSTMSLWDVGVVLVLVVVALGGVKLGYAAMAHRVRLFFNRGKVYKRFNMVSGSVLVGIGVVVLMKI